MRAKGIGGTVGFWKDEHLLLIEHKTAAIKDLRKGTKEKDRKRRLR